MLSTQVLEHVTDPRLYLAECHRVLRPGGPLLLSTHGIMVYHPDPVDYWRWTGAGLQRAVTAGRVRGRALRGDHGARRAPGCSSSRTRSTGGCPRSLGPLVRARHAGADRGSLDRVEGRGEQAAERAGVRARRGEALKRVAADACATAGALQRGWRVRGCSRAFAAAYPEAFFVEIGSNDGEQHDHLRPVHPRSAAGAGSWSSRCPYVFERLRANYGDVERRRARERRRRRPRRDAAVLPPGDAGRRPSGRPARLVRRDRLVLARRRAQPRATQIPDIEAAARRARGAQPDLRVALRAHGVERVDLLLIDTEGYDWEILRPSTSRRGARGCDLRALPPRAGRSGERCRAHLGEAGYETLEEGFDTFCLRPGRRRA